MSKFLINFCSCGRIHFIKMDDVEKALLEDKDILFVCQGCGNTSFIGADKTVIDNETAFNIYKYTKNKDFEITPKDFEPFILTHKDTSYRKPISKIMFSQGKTVFMLNGFAANYYANGFYRDTWFTDFDDLKKKGITEEDIKCILDKWEYESTTVDMTRLINDLSEDELKELSGYAINAFDWSGTKYERK